MDRSKERPMSRQKQSQYRGRCISPSRCGARTATFFLLFAWSLLSREHIEGSTKEGRKKGRKEGGGHPFVFFCRFEDDGKCHALFPSTSPRRCQRCLAVAKFAAGFEDDGKYHDPFPRIQVTAARRCQRCPPPLFGANAVRMIYRNILLLFVLRLFACFQLCQHIFRVSGCCFPHICFFCLCMGLLLPACSCAGRGGHKAQGRSAAGLEEGQACDEDSRRRAREGAASSGPYVVPIK